MSTGVDQLVPLLVLESKNIWRVPSEVRVSIEALAVAKKSPAGEKQGSGGGISHDGTAAKSVRAISGNGLKICPIGAVIHAAAKGDVDIAAVNIADGDPVLRESQQTTIGSHTQNRDAVRRCPKIVGR